MKKKKLYMILLIVGGSLINLINTPLTQIIRDFIIKISYEADTAYYDNVGLYAFYAADFLGMCPLGTVFTSLLGGIVPGMITAVLSEIGFILTQNDTSDANIYILAVNVLFALSCSFFREKELFKKKRDTVIFALLLGTLYSARLFFVKWVAMHPSQFIPFFVVIFIELFICRKLMPIFDRYIPVKEEKPEGHFRKHSIKRELLLIVNVSAVFVFVTFLGLSAHRYYSDMRNDSISRSKYVDALLWKECGEEISGFRSYDDIESFDDNILNSILGFSANDVQISGIHFIYGNPYDFSGNEVYEYLGFIRNEYTKNDEGYYEVKCEKIKDGTFEKSMLMQDNVVVNYYNDVSVIFIIDNVDMSDIWSYVGNMMVVAVSIIILMNAFVIRFVDKRIIITLNRMAASAAKFAYDTDEHRTEAMNNFKALDIASGDEVENLYNSITKTMEDMNGHIVNIKEQARRISDMQHNIILTMADIVESRDENTGGHIRRTAEYVKIIAENLRESGKFGDILTDEYIEDMIVAAPLHDMGKIHVSDSILNKPGKLDKDEYAVMQSHTTAGRDLLKNATHTLGAFSYLDMAVQMAAYHHEKWNGKGYPEGISGEDIPLCARIMAVADVFDALISKRCYKEPMPLEKAYSIIREGAGEDFDPVVVDAFFASNEKIENAMNDFN